MVFPQTALAIGVVDFPQTALAIGVLTSSWWVRVCRFCGFIVSSGVCRGQGSQIQDRAVVTQGVIEAVI